MKEHSSTAVFLLLLLFIVVVALVTSCCDCPTVPTDDITVSSMSQTTEAPNIPQKPFIVTSKHFPFSGKRAVDLSRYEAIDKNGRTYYFTDLSNLYHIGDTIK